MSLSTSNHYKMKANYSLPKNRLLTTSSSFNGFVIIVTILIMSTTCTISSSFTLISQNNNIISSSSERRSYHCKNNGYSFTNLVTSNYYSSMTLHSSLNHHHHEHQHDNNNNNDDDEEDDDQNHIDKQQRQQNKRRKSEFESIEPRSQSFTYQKRMEEEQHAQNIFVPYGNELWKLRSTLLHLSKQLIQIIAQSYDESNKNNDSNIGSVVNEPPIISEEDIREMIRECESKDPELVYAMEREMMEQAMEEDRLEDAQEHKKKALVARNALPQFNLHGLWVGK